MDSLYEDVLLLKPGVDRTESSESVRSSQISGTLPTSSNKGTNHSASLPAISANICAPGSPFSLGHLPVRVWRGDRTSLFFITFGPLKRDPETSKFCSTCDSLLIDASCSVNNLSGFWGHSRIGAQRDSNPPLCHIQQCSGLTPGSARSRITSGGGVEEPVSLWLWP